MTDHQSDEDGGGSVANSACYPNSKNLQVISMIGNWLFQNNNYIKNLQKKNAIFDGFMTMKTSNGIKYGSQGILNSSLPHLLGLIIAVVVVSRILHFSLRYFKQPLIVCQLITGILIFSFLPKPEVGRSIKNNDRILNPTVYRVESVLGLAGVLFNLFVVAIKFDSSTIWEFGKKKPIMIGLASQLTTFAAGCIIYGFLHKQSKPFGGKNGDFLFYLLQPLTSTYPISLTDIFEEYGLLNSELGRLALSSSMAQFFTGWVFIIVLLAAQQGSMLSGLKTTLCIMLIFIFIILVIRPYALWIIRFTPPNARVRSIHIIIIILIVVFLAMAGDIVGFVYIGGPVIMGFIIPAGPPLGTALIGKLDLVATEVLFPLVFVGQGYYMDWADFRRKPSLVRGVEILVVVSFLAKLVASIAAAKFCKMTLKDGFIIGLMMNFRGLIDLLFYVDLINQEIIDRSTFTALLLSTAVALVLSTPLVVYYYKPLGTRKKMGYRRVKSACSSHELSVMTCFYDENPIPALLEFFEFFSPFETDNSIRIYTIHIVELQGRAESNLICHRNKKGSVNSEQMDHIHNHFINFEQSKNRGVTVVPFTSLTPLKSMHQDVCSLILKMDVAFVIVPYPKKNSLAASKDNAAMHDLVPLVLKEASCSVGIMVHDGKERETISGSCWQYHICVLFFGGPDDREAIAIASNLARHPGINLSILRFVASGRIEYQQQNDDNQDKSGDDMVISEFQEANAENNSVAVTDIIVLDMEQTFSIIQALGEKHDLLIIGRRQEHSLMLGSNLEEWIETPELGVIGDIISTDASCVANMLIVQQHKL